MAIQAIGNPPTAPDGAATAPISRAPALGLAAVPSSITTAAPAADYTLINSDAQRVFLIKCLLGVLCDPETFGPIAFVRRTEDIDEVLNLFRQIQSPAAKIEAFQAVLRPVNLTGTNMAKRFYIALPPELQDQFRYELWVANGRSDDGLGIHFGQHMIDSGLSFNPMAQRAAQALHDSLVAPTNDAQRVLLIQRILGISSVPELLLPIAVIVRTEGIAEALNLFGQIQSPAAKIEAFQAVLCPFNFTSFDTTKQFYAALPSELQDEFRHQLWIANGRSDNGLGIHFGQHMVDSNLTHNPIAQQAAQALHAMLVAATNNRTH